MYIIMLEIKNLSLIFPETAFQALFNLSFNINEGEILALVGESGSGKSLTALSILGLQPVTARLDGSIMLGEDFLLKAVQDRPFSSKVNPLIHKFRGKRIAFIPQDPLSSLNPVYTIGDQIIEAIVVHHPDFAERKFASLFLTQNDKQRLKQKVIDGLNAVGIADPERTYSAYPHELSGGMRQRGMIAMAIVNEPDLLIADEPTTALDVTVQALILKLLKSLNKTILFITHDLGVVAEIADRVIVMQSGRIVEEKSVFDIFEKAESAYTKELLAAIPRI